MVDDQVGSPDLHRPPRPRPSSSSRRPTTTASTTHRRRRRAPGSSSRARSSAGRARTRRVEPCTTAEFQRPGAAARLLGAGQRAPGRPPAAVAGRARRLPRGARVKLLVTGAAGFIGSDLRPARRRTTTTWWCSTSSPTPAGARTCRRRRVELVEGAIEDRDLVREPMRRASTRWSTSPPRRTWTARSPTRTRSRART